MINSKLKDGEIVMMGSIPYVWIKLESKWICRPAERHDSEDAFFIPDTTERFNVGLGCVTAGTRDAEKKAKARGLEPIGDTPIEKCFRREKQPLKVDHIIQEGLKANRAGRNLEGVPLAHFMKGR